MQNFHTRDCRVLLSIGLTVCASTVVSAQHEGDVFIGRTLQNRVARGGFDVDQVLIYLSPVTGLLRGWSDNDPGFDRLVVARPDLNLYPLPVGALIRLELVSIDPALRAIDNSLQILDAPGESTFLGDHTLHAHVTWHINSSDPRFDPTECIWYATFILRDVGNLRLLSSTPFTLRFTNVLPRAADGDWDENHVVNLEDLAALTDCLSGPNQPPHPESEVCPLSCINAFDFDGDQDVDLEDAAQFQRALTNA